jgi:hypothetical protein
VAIGQLSLDRRRHFGIEVHPDNGAGGEPERDRLAQPFGALPVPLISGQIGKELRSRIDAGYEQMISGSGAGDIEQGALGVVDFFAIGFVERRARCKSLHALIATACRDATPIAGRSVRLHSANLADSHICAITASRAFECWPAPRHAYSIDAEVALDDRYRFLSLDRIALNGEIATGNARSHAAS